MTNESLNVVTDPGLGTLSMDPLQDFREDADITKKEVKGHMS